MQPSKHLQRHSLERGPALAGPQVLLRSFRPEARCTDALRGPGCGYRLGGIRGPRPTQASKGGHQSGEIATDSKKIQIEI